jgi:hypothetical protein
MSPARCTSLFVLLVAAGCLQPGPPPEGAKLAGGRDISVVGFASINGVPSVVFNRRKAPATVSKGAVSDLWIVPWDNIQSCQPTQPRLVVANQSGRWGNTPAGGSFFAMVDEQQVTSGGAGGGQVEAVGTLVRVDSNYQPNLAFENVSTFAPYSDNRLLLRQVPPGDTPGLFLWDGGSQVRLGDVASVSLFNAQFAGSGVAYFVLGSDHVLSRLDKLTDTKQDLHPNVSRFLLQDDEKYAALSLSTAGTSKTVVFELDSGKEIPLALPNPCCWGGFAGDLFTYSQSASGDAPAESHTLDLVTGIDTTLVLPAPLVDLGPVVPRPNSDEDLYLDSQGHGVFLGHNDHQVRRVVQRFDQATQTWVPVTMLLCDTTSRFRPFSPDGQYLIYVDPQPTTEAEPDPHGPLMVQDSNLVNPPRQLSTPGMSVWGGGCFFIIPGPSGARRRGRDPGAQDEANDPGAQGEANLFSIQGPSGPILGFSASIVRASADFYFANYETGALRVVASSIGNVTVDGYQQIFGTVNVSAQDETGDLVVEHLQDSGGRILAHAVTEFTSWAGGLVAYVVRGRAASDHDGLWGSTMAPPGQDGGR